MRALLPGRFDPPTLAHEGLIRRAAAFLAPLVVAVAPDAPGDLLPAATRAALLRARLADLDVEIVVAGGGDAELAASLGCARVVRGLRPLDAVSLPEAGAIETLYLPAEPATSHIRSRLVRDVMRLGGDPSPFLAPEVLAAITKGL